MTKEFPVVEFGKRLCAECGIAYKGCLGMTDDILAIAIDDNDVNGKTKLKNWLKQHHWEFVGVDERHIKIHPCLDEYVDYKVITYKHNNHKIMIECNK